MQQCLYKKIKGIVIITFYPSSLCEDFDKKIIEFTNTFINNKTDTLSSLFEKNHISSKEFPSADISTETIDSICNAIEPYFDFSDEDINKAYNEDFFGDLN